MAIYTSPQLLRASTRDRRPRLRRLGHPEELTGRESPVQRTANELIAAELALTHHQTRFIYARREGDQLGAWDAASRQTATARRIDALRRRLRDQRRRELLAS
jgi:hypothetical protein